MHGAPIKKTITNQYEDGRFFYLFWGLIHAVHLNATLWGYDRNKSVVHSRERKAGRKSFLEFLEFSRCPALWRKPCMRVVNCLAFRFTPHHTTLNEGKYKKKKMILSFVRFQLHTVNTIPYGLASCDPPNRFLLCRSLNQKVKKIHYEGGFEGKKKKAFFPPPLTNPIPAGGTCTYIITYCLCIL